MSPLLLLRPAMAARIAGSILSAEGGQAVSGVPVIAYDERLDYVATTSTSDGSFELTGLEAGRYRVWAWPTDGTNRVARFWPQAWSYCDAELIILGPDEERDDLEFNLELGGRIQGRVTDLEGAPIIGADVRCEGLDGRVQGVQKQALTDGDGRFELVGLDSDQGVAAGYLVEVEVRGWPDQWLGQVYDDDDADVVEVARGDVVALDDWSLLDGIDVQGNLSGPDGPVVGASVHSYATGQVVSVLSDEAGDFNAQGLPPGDVLVWGSLAGYGLTYYPDSDRPAERLPAPDEGSLLDGVQLDMPWESRLVGEFVEPPLNDMPDLSGVTVLAYNDSFTVGVGAQANADGLFEVDRLHGGLYTLFVYARTEGYLSDFIRDASGEPVEFDLEAQADSPTVQASLPVGATIIASVRDDLGQPIYGLTYYAVHANEDLAPRAEYTDREGQLEMQGLHAGSYEIELRYSVYCPNDPGYVPTWHPGEVDVAYTLPLELAEGEVVELEYVVDRDFDHDEMGDGWEEEHDLEVGRDDSAEDPDGDGYSNLQEYRLGTDPNSQDAEGDCEGGCQGGKAGLLPVLLPLLAVRRRRGRTPA